MKLPLFLLILFALISCQSDSKEASSQDMTKREVSLPPPSPFAWSQIKQHFPEREVLSFDFAPDRTPLHQVEGLSQVDTVFRQHLISQVKFYQQWEEYLSFFYFSRQQIGEEEVGIILALREYNGLTYLFDLIRLDESGTVLTYANLSDSWRAAECFGYSRTTLNIERMTISKQILKKCYNEELESMVTDSSVASLSLTNFRFDTLSSSTYPGSLHSH